MAKLIFILSLLWVSVFGFSQTGTVILNIQNIEASKGGEISAGIFKRENFPRVGKQFIGIEKEVIASETQVVFTNVPVGLYAIVVFQDTDMNKDLKTNFVGYPKEPIGFSNDAKIKFGPPSFDDAKVSVEADKKLILVIKLQ